MSAVFGEFLAEMLRESGVKQEAMCNWLLRNQHEPKRFKTETSIKEHLRVLRLNKVSAVDYPLLPDIARFFDERGNSKVASSLRHIYLQQSYDIGCTNHIYDEASPISEGVKWMVFPDIDRASFDKHMAEWVKQLRNGSKQLLRESLEFYFRYSESYVHGLVRQQIAAELARASLNQAEYAQAYLVAETYRRRWLEVFNDARLRTANYKIQFNDLYNYLRLLQTQASAVSFIFYHAPSLASRKFFHRAWKELVAAERFIARDSDTKHSLYVQFHIQRIRMVCRALMSISLVEQGEDALLRSSLEKEIRISLKKLRIAYDAVSPKGKLQYDNEFVVRDTEAKALSLLATSVEELDEVLRIIDRATATKSSYKFKALETAGPLKSYRSAATYALCCISKYRITRSEKDLLQVDEALKALTLSVDFTKQRHVRFTVDSLAIYTMYCQYPYRKIALRTCDLPTIEESLGNLDQSEVLKKCDSMFSINADDPDFVSCLLQANRYNPKYSRSGDLLEFFELA